MRRSGTPTRPSPRPAGGAGAPRFRRRALTGAAVALALATALPAQEPPDAGPPGLDLPVRMDTLDNGMRVLALHRPGAPTASFVLHFGIGSVNEALGQTGVAHLLEHLLFKGTTTVGTSSLAGEMALFPAMDAAQDTLLMIREGRLAGTARVRLERRIEALEDSARQYVRPNEFVEIMSEHGARELNATTGYESTTYYCRLPANHAEVFFVMEADRMANPVFREFYAERDVVAEERRTRLEASPGGRLGEEFYAAAYRVHPYGVPVIGHMSDIRTHTRADVADYHARYYRPGNAILAVVGDIDPDRILAWARRYFGPIPRGESPPPATAEEPDQRGERRIRVEVEAEPDLLIGWHVPDGYHRDAPALAVLSRVLTDGRTSRLYRRLAGDDPLVTAVQASVGPAFAGPRLFTIAAQPIAGHSTDEIEAAIYDEIARLQDDPPTDRELERVRLQVEAADVRRLASNLGLAFQLAESVAYHDDWKETFRSGARLTGVTRDDVLRVARQYLVERNRTVAVLVSSGGREAP
jgi:predicted Zn-dependent peptidase